tara:strand:- start:8207 stop:8548 length:342 start_codon:yes stop_codon:yes gene_type:complete
MTRYADENAKIDGAVFPMKERKHNKMPELTGVLEFSKTMLKSMVEEAKAGNTPVRVRLAVWPEQNGKNPPHNPYRFVKLELLYPSEAVTAETSLSQRDREPEPSSSDDAELPW